MYQHKIVDFVQAILFKLKNNVLALPESAGPPRWPPVPGLSPRHHQWHPTESAAKHCELFLFGLLVYSTALLTFFWIVQILALLISLISSSCFLCYWLSINQLNIIWQSCFCLNREETLFPFLFPDTIKQILFRSTPVVLLCLPSKDIYNLGKSNTTTIWDYIY